MKFKDIEQDTLFYRNQYNIHTTFMKTKDYGLLLNCGIKCIVANAVSVKNFHDKIYANIVLIDDNEEIRIAELHQTLEDVL